MKDSQRRAMFARIKLGSIVKFKPEAGDPIKSYHTWKVISVNGKTVDIRRNKYNSTEFPISNVPKSRLVLVKSGYKE